MVFNDLCLYKVKLAEAVNMAQNSLQRRMLATQSDTQSHCNDNSPAYATTRTQTINHSHTPRFHRHISSQTIYDKWSVIT